MDKQQNIDDILKLLKNSYGDDDSSSKETETIQSENIAATDELSHDELQKKLKEQFISDTSSAAEADDSEGESFEYNIDGEFLETAAAEKQHTQPGMCQSKLRIIGQSLTVIPDRQFIFAIFFSNKTGSGQLCRGTAVSDPGISLFFLFLCRTI